ncbi:MAG: alpha/beta fold hydrolase [Verrucomicrobia bacterium]|nr:alpha/beta fold hydrolase [Verrucomicrobiota bacterium]
MDLPLFTLCLGLGLSLARGAEPATNRPSSLQRLQPEHLMAAHAARLRFAAQRQTLPNLGVFEDFRAVMHVHAEDAEHTKGTRPEVLAAAKKTGVRIVLFTDHNGPKAETWRGLRDGVLFIAGAEFGGEGLLKFPEFRADGRPRSEGELRFLSHIEERYDAPTTNLVGMEISNRHTDAKLDQGPYLKLMTASANADLWRKLVDGFQSYPDEFFAASEDYHARIFEKWDRENQQHPLTGIAANDAHQNQIFKGTTFDPYAVSFRNLSTHILARELTEPAVREALRAGHAYVAHDWLCDPTGFAFRAVNNLGVFTMGDPVPWLGPTRVAGLTPLAAHLKLIHRGALVAETMGTNLTFVATNPGPYRLEAWLPVDGEERAWIFSNPIYLQGPSLTAMRLTSPTLSPEVQARKDLVYAPGSAEDAPKHKLDLYLPRGRISTPVFFFIHGGAWKYGDRSQYVALGNRFAKEGILTVVPSYRLAPKHPFPAQIEDVAAAFAWTVRHIAEYGGDTNRIYVGGHSAGGHLAALLALDSHYLAAHGLSPRIIRGVAALSGVYDLTGGDSLESVFGRDPIRRRDASPRYHVRAGAPPFLVAYCEWDYLTLPLQARRFYAALRQAGVAAELLFVPRESHISEMVNVPNADSPIARAIWRQVQ